MSDFSRVMRVNEKVLWSGKPAKKAFILPALGGIPFGLLFLTFFFVWLAGVPLLATMPIELAIMLAGWGFGVILVPPIWQLLKYPNIEYAVTNQRLIIQSWAFKKRTFSADYGEIKDFGVKFGLVDKLLGTGTIYPITASYPFAPGRWFPYTNYGDGGGNPWRVHRLFNPATGKYEELTEMQIWRRTTFHPALQALEKPLEIQKLLKDVIMEKRQLESPTPLEMNANLLSTNEQIAGVDSSQLSFPMRVKVAAVLGGVLLLAGASVFAFGFVTGYTPFVSYENGYTYIDYVAVLGFGFIFVGTLALFIAVFLFLPYSRRRYMRKHGWNERS